MNNWGKLHKEVADCYIKLMVDVVESLGGERCIHMLHRFRDRDCCEVIAYQKSGIGYKIQQEHTDDSVTFVAIPGKYFPPPFPPND